MSVGRLVLRLAVGTLFVGHGLQKLRGSFGGPGLEGTEKMAESLELRPAHLNARAVALTETVGGAAIAIGAATPLAAGGLVATMITAVRKVHWSNGVWNSNGGFEYNAVLIAALTAITDLGPGRLSVDALFGKARWHFPGALAALVIGVVGSTAIIELGRRAPAAESAAVVDENTSES